MGRIAPVLERPGPRRWHLRTGYLAQLQGPFRYVMFLDGPSVIARVLTMERWTSEGNNQRKKMLNYLLWTFQVALVEKNLPTNAGDLGDVGLIPGSGRSLEMGMATHSNILAWKIPWTEEPGGLQSMGSQSWTQLSD